MSFFDVCKCALRPHNGRRVMHFIKPLCPPPCISRKNVIKYLCYEKILATLSAVAVAAAGALTFFRPGSAEVMYSLSEDGTYYILSGVSGNTSALKAMKSPPSTTTASTVNCP